MCTDFTNLNRTCPKDTYPLPHIDQLVDAMAGHEVLIFMDAYLRHNKIRMDSRDKEMTSFITNQCLYYYKVMSFGLKNAGAIYQC